MGTDNDTLALLFPWHTSSILVPLATTVLLTGLMNRLAGSLPPSSLRRETILKSAFVAALVVFAAGGAAIRYLDLGYRTDEKEVKLLEFIRANKAPGESIFYPSRCRN